MWRTVYGACNYRQSPATRPLRGESLATSPDWPPGTTPLCGIEMHHRAASLCVNYPVSPDSSLKTLAVSFQWRAPSFKTFHCVNDFPSRPE